MAGPYLENITTFVTLQKITVLYITKDYILNDIALSLSWWVCMCISKLLDLLLFIILSIRLFTIRKILLIKLYNNSSTVCN